LQNEYRAIEDKNSEEAKQIKANIDNIVSPKSRSGGSDEKKWAFEVMRTSTAKPEDVDPKDVILAEKILGLDKPKIDKREMWAGDELGASIELFGTADASNQTPEQRKQVRLLAQQIRATNAANSRAPKEPKEPNQPAVDVTEYPLIAQQLGVPFVASPYKGVNDKILAKIDDDIFLSYIVIDRELETSLVSDLVFYYKSESNLPEIQKIVDGVNKCMVDFCEEDSYNLNTISLTNTGLEIEPLSISYDFESFDLYYSNNTLKSLNKSIKKIKKNNRGLVILNGERGVGKTSAIKYIADNLDRIVIFIPNSLLEHTLNNSDFRKFLKKYSKPVLVLDDCEMIFNDYFSKSNMLVNNLLQIVDGLIYDDVTILAIFNVEMPVTFKFSKSKFLPLIKLNVAIPDTSS
jgi:flagellar biosynthesis GTPase FlhF